jgi:hypothetical protein
MNGKAVKDRLVGDSWLRAAVILLVGVGGGGTGTTLLAQKFKGVADDVKDIKEDIRDIKSDMKELLRRTPVQ